MGCVNCGKESVGLNCSTGGCGKNGGCSSGDCGKLGTFDWLSGISDPIAYPKFDLVEVRFKGGRKDFYRNSDNIDLVVGDDVIVDVQGGHHLGFVSLTGELVKLQMKKKKVKDSDEIRKIYRIATSKDLETHTILKEKEGEFLYRSRQIIDDLKLSMKLSDVEVQSDGNKASFFYSAEDRVDFRELIKHLATEFKIRIEMRQINLRQEAGRLGGIGSCGRELCCSTWLTEFKSVPTSAARYQNISINPAKISGQCGRLKCCLNYELNTYMEALKDFPTVKKPLKTSKGNMRLEKTDIFKKTMWFSIEDETDWVALPVSEVKKIIELNKKGKVANAFSQIVTEPKEANLDKVVNLENNLDNLDKKLTKKKKQNKNRNRNKRKGKKRPDAKKD